MIMEYPWNDEVVAQFYATLWVKKVDEEADTKSATVVLPIF
jgi:hypothetical protein